MYAAKVIEDSIANGIRLTTIEVTFPRFVLAEFNTHRMFSRNSASSRAIPVEKRIAEVRSNPFVPEAFAQNKRGMQAGDVLDQESAEKARFEWTVASQVACDQAEALADVGVHKQWANRLIEPFSWHTVVVTATEWENFLNLRISKLAQPEIRRAAELMKNAMDASDPVPLFAGGWHLPYVSKTERECWATEPDMNEFLIADVSSARCARVSYLTHDGRRDIDADLTLSRSLSENRHMSPFEHAAVVEATDNGPGMFCGNFRRPWLQYRKMMVGEDVAPKETP